MLDEGNSDPEFDLYCEFSRPGLVVAGLDKQKWTETELIPGATDSSVRYSSDYSSVFLFRTRISFLKKFCNEGCIHEDSI